MPAGKQRIICSGVRFEDDTPSIVFDVHSGGARERFEKKVLGMPIALRRYKSRYCTGRYDLATFRSEPCPSGARLEDSSAIQCRECFDWSAFNPAFYNVPRSELSEAQRIYNEQPHSVYLAGFSEDLIKVGISNSRRTRIRLLEQGALLAQIVALAPSAYEARKIECMIRDRLGLPETASGAAKMRALGASTPDLLAHGLRRAFERVRGLGIAGAVDNEVEELYRVYFGADMPAFDGGIADVSAGTPLVFNGMGVGLVGASLLARHERLGFLGVSVRRFLGHVVDFETADVPVPMSQRQSVLV